MNHHILSQSAIDAIRLELKNRNGSTNIVEDIEGKLSNYDGKSLTYTECKDKPAIYYRSNFGNYRCVIYVKTRNVNN